MVEEWGKPRRSFMGFFKVICPNCKKEFRYPLSPGYTACYWILLIGNIVWALYLISQGRFGPNPIGLVVLIFVIISLFKSSKLKREIDQLKEKLPNLSEEITECVKCGGRNFEHDIYLDEYNCENCGWTSKEKPKGKVNIRELQTKDNESGNEIGDKSVPDSITLKAELIGLDELRDQLLSKLKALPKKDIADLPDQFRKRPSQTIEGIENAVKIITEKLQKQADRIFQNVTGIEKLRADISATTAPKFSLSVCIWRYFRNGASDGILNIVIKTGENSFTYIWTP
jgi:DNA-directed RNA polymerase subunit RPC12/RpoP